jgi:hypothetical protein
MIYLSGQGFISLSDPELRNYSATRAREIEAACWSPRLRISDIDYQMRTLRKAHELMSVLCRQYGLRAAPLTIPQIQATVRHHPVALPRPSPPVLPVNQVNLPPIAMFLSPPVLPASPPAKQVVVSRPKMHGSVQVPQVTTPSDSAAFGDGGSGHEEDEYPMEWNQGPREFESICDFPPK